MSLESLKHMHRWIPGYGLHAFRKLAVPPPEGPKHLLFAVCDHYEPLWAGVAPAQGRERVARWEREYPALASEFRDAYDRPPRHTFFFPGEQYAASYLAALGRLARAGLGEVELHLHHDGDDPAKLEHDIRSYLGLFSQHGLLARDAGRLRYGFIHGNWCLANSRRDGRYCGVDCELQVLFDTGCYADFTFPSAPDASQPGIVNQIYWPAGDPQRARSHERGIRARVGQVMADRILMVQGPLALTRRESRVLSARIENAAVTANDPGTARRVKAWVAQNIHIEGRPEWLFVKVHTHGAPEAQADSLLGEAGRNMHRALRNYNDGKQFVLHYVSAREMFNIAMAGMHGLSGDPDDYRDRFLAPPPVAA